MAGGVISDNTPSDYAKVELNGGGIFWYKNTISDLEIGDEVIVPVGETNKLTNAKVLKIDRNISPQCAPVPSKRAKYIFDKVRKI